MRFLRPDLLNWWLIAPALVAAWGLHWRATRAFRRTARIDPRFAALSRRTTWRRDAAVLAASLVAASATVFALNMDCREPRHAEARMTLAQACLADIGAI